MISARKGQGAGRRARRRRGGGGRKRKRGRGVKNEVKFIRVQTDVNLFKLRDFGSGRGEGGEGEGVGADGVYCGATGAALFALSLRGTRDGRGAGRAPFCGKLKSPPAFRLGRAFQTEARGNLVPRLARTTIPCRGDLISRRDAGS